MLWVKAFHIIFMVTWFAGLFYLPRLFVYHAQAVDEISIERFKVMERKLFFGIMTPGALLTLGLGMWMLVDYAWASWRDSLWLPLKLSLIVGLVAYHLYCGKLLMEFKNNRNAHSHIFYRWLNEAPVIVMIAIILLAVLKP